MLGLLLHQGEMPGDDSTAAVSYAFNRNLVERPEKAVRYAANTMMVREMDRRVDAELRPTNYSCGRPDVPPDSPFLTKHDSRMEETNPGVHGEGSNVLFADGHVQGFHGFLKPDTSPPRGVGLPRLGAAITSQDMSKTIRITP